MIKEKLITNELIRKTFNEEIPYDTIDMDFMNENQSAHGGREYGHIVSRMGIERKVIVGHWADKKVQERLASWMRTAVGIMESSHIRVCRVADNMRNVAVTEGDKVEAQIKFGWEVDAYPVNEVADYVKDVSKGDIDVLVEEYYNKYDILLEGRDPEEFKRHVAVQAAIEIGFEKFLEEKNYQAVVTHFGDLGSLQQLPGLAMQRLMEKGYGFGAEAWILDGGAHHTAFTYDLTAEQMGDWAAAMGIEAVYIDKDTTIRNFKNELRWNEIAFRK